MRLSPELAASLEAGVAVVAVGALCVPLVLVLRSDGPSLTVSPTVVRPDGHVTLTAHGCPVPAVVSSEAFDSVLLDTGGRSRVLRIDSSVVPARYRLRLECNGRTSEVQLLVTNGPVPGDRILLAGLPRSG
jgi:hypothetical protein